MSYRLILTVLGLTCVSNIAGQDPLNVEPAPPAAAAAAAGNDSAPSSGIPIDPLEDEDNLVTGTEIGDPMIRSQMTQYIEQMTSQLVGLSNDNSQRDKITKRYPIFKLLEHARVVMQKTCPQLTPEYLSMATTTFTNLQLQNFHLREPYISYSAFLRINSAMEKCAMEAKPHKFVIENGTTFMDKEGLYCRSGGKRKTSNKTISQKSGQEVDLTLPSYASGYVTEPDILSEPLIETVWKILVNAHSYCYTRFSDYFNDHHTFTVSMVPLFTNSIQDVWQKGYDLSNSSNNIIYGGLLGDPRMILNNINNCVAASREEGQAYPWFMNRPPRDKSQDWA